MFNCGYPVSSCVGGEIFNTENSKREKLYFLGGNEFVVLKGGVWRHDVLKKKNSHVGKEKKRRKHSYSLLCTYGFFNGKLIILSQ